MREPDSGISEKQRLSRLFGILRNLHLKSPFLGVVGKKGYDMSANMYFKGMVLKDNGYFLLLAVFLLYMCVGIFPLYCYESDSMHTIMGMATLYNQGMVAPPIYSYEYAMQPLVYFVTAGLRHILPFLTCEQLYCLLTGVATLFFIPLTIRFIYSLTNIPKNFILLALFLIPETMAIGMYPNTAILALLPVMIGLDSLMRKNFITAVLALAIAPLFRVDVLMIYPVVLFLYMWQGDGWKSAIKKTIVLALCVTVLMVLGFIVMRANPLVSSLKGYESWNEKMGLSKIFFAIFSFYDVINLFLLPSGIYIVAKQKNIKLMLLGITPILLNHFVYRSMGCATKHFLYMLPFVAVFTSVAINWIEEVTTGKVRMRYVLAGMLILFLFGSTRIHSTGKPWRNDAASDAQCGPVLHLFTEKVTPLQVSFGIGAGEVLTTLDEMMLVSGNAFYPWYIHNLKTGKLRLRTQAAYHLGNKNCILIGNTWSNKADMPLYFMDKGFHFERNGKNIMLTNGHQTITLKNDDELKLSGDLTQREANIEKAILKIKEYGKPCYVYAEGTNIFLYNRQAEKGNVEKVPGTGSLYLITPSK